MVVAGWCYGPRFVVRTLVFVSAHHPYPLFMHRYQSRLRFDCKARVPTSIVHDRHDPLPSDSPQADTFLSSTSRPRKLFTQSIGASFGPCNMIMCVFSCVAHFHALMEPTLFIRFSDAEAFRCGDARVRQPTTLRMPLCPAHDWSLRRRRHRPASSIYWRQRAYRPPQGSLVDRYSPDAD